MAEPTQESPIRTKQRFDDWWHFSATAGGVAVSAFRLDEWSMAIDTVIKEQNQLFANMAHEHINNGIPTMAGFLAESWHSGTYNIDSQAKGLGFTAEVPRSTEKSSPDMRIRNTEGEVVSEYQSKYYKTPEATTSELSQSGYQVYKKIAPDNQIDDIKRDASARAAKESAKEGLNRQEKAACYEHTANNVDGQVRDGGAESQPLSKDGAHDLARKAKQGDASPYSYAAQVNGWVRIKEIGAAAGQAAVLNATLHALPDLVISLRRLYSDDKYQFIDAAGETVVWVKEKGIKVGADTFVKSALAGLLKDAAMAGKLGEAAQTLPGAYFAGAAVTAVETAYAFLRCARGECSIEKATADSLKVGLRTTASTAGSAVFQVMIPIPVLGSMLGSFLAGFVVDQGIERIESDSIYVYMVAMDRAFGQERDLIRQLFGGVAVTMESLKRYEELLEGNMALLHSTDRMVKGGDTRNGIAAIAAYEAEKWISELKTEKFKPEV